MNSEMLKQFKDKFEADSKNILAQNVCNKHDLWEICKQQNVVWEQPHIFNNKAGEGKPMTNQKSSGRCWIFACLNVMRQPMSKHFKLDDLEFSQNYLFFWDKVERANFLLDSFVKTAQQGETFDGRLVHHLLSNPSEDGGQWDMLVNLVEKYGLMPKACFPDSYSAEASVKFGRIINNKLREFCMKLHIAVNKGQTEADINVLKTQMMEEIYRICRICVGNVPETFTWQYYDNEKAYKCIGPISPLDFYKEHIKPIYNMEDKVCIVNDPRSNNPPGKLYTVDYLNNMTGGRPVLYINQTADVLKSLAIASIQNEESVWFGCDVGKCFNARVGVLDLNVHNTNLVFGTSLLNMTKAERLQYSESLMTHAMVLTAVHLKDDKSALRWRVENSWGDADGDKGYLVMSDDWFTEFVYEVVIDKKYLPEDVLNVLTQTPVVLPAWDPMGALA